MKALSVNQLNSKTFGLRFQPTWEPHLSDAAREAPNTLSYQPPCGYDNSLEVINHLRGVAEGAERILEIGVALYSPERSFTTYLARPGYLGVDIEPRIVEKGRFLQCNSTDFVRVSGALEGPLDLLVIDGDHSVQGCLNDWKYAQFVRIGGLVVLHDSNSHPGPIAVVEAIDRTVFSVDEPFLGQQDFGLAVCRRLL